ncbi:hypothetical protein VK96_14585 [Bacillus cereus]|uniref:class I adenylate-forming enzyme family protein n=1 Tax=Bacillus cereus TaxID=1396 RepID=UPI00065D729C|nr:class I adenylate-forming enzyme family protein [Bacillus cereus]KMN69821.1 hypothetical protein VK96_14585 [Bacillus cereus]
MIAKFYENLKSGKDKTFIIDNVNGGTVSCEEFLGKSISFANYFYKRGIRKGDKIALVMGQSDSVNVLALYFANLLLKTVVIPINSSYILKDKQDLLNRTAPTLVVSSEKYIQEEVNYEVITLDNILLQVVNCNKLELEFEMEELDDNDTMAILFTSGTTSAPKCIGVKYGTYKSVLINIEKNTDIKLENKRIMIVTPIVHSSGLSFAFFIPLYFNGSVILNETFNARICLSFWDICKKHEANAVLTVPSILSSLLATKNRYNEYSLETVFCGSAPLSKSVREEFENYFNTEIREFYASTEMNLMSLSRKSANNSGPMFPNYKMLVSENGELCVQSNCMNDIYLGMEENSEYFYTDQLGSRWFKTGDLVEVNSKEEISVIGRIKDLIIKGGLNISPDKIDSVLIEHPAITESGTIGVPDDFYGEKVVSMVSSQDEFLTREDIYNFCTNNLSQSNRPDEIIIIAELPKNKTGKIDRNELKNKYREYIELNTIKIGN